MVNKLAVMMHTLNSSYYLISGVQIQTPKKDSDFNYGSMGCQLFQQGVQNWKKNA